MPGCDRLGYEAAEALVKRAFEKHVGATLVASLVVERRPLAKNSRRTEIDVRHAALGRSCFDHQACQRPASTFRLVERVEWRASNHTRVVVPVFGTPGRHEPRFSTKAWPIRTFVRDDEGETIP